MVRRKRKRYPVWLDKETHGKLMKIKKRKEKEKKIMSLKQIVKKLEAKAGRLI